MSDRGICNDKPHLSNGEGERERISNMQIHLLFSLKTLHTYLNIFQPWNGKNILFREYVILIRCIVKKEKQEILYNNSNKKILLLSLSFKIIASKERKQRKKKEEI